MAQHDFNIDNASGSVVRADINDALDAIATNNSGSSAPGTTFANQWWFDTSNNLLKIRNAANTAWITVAEKNGNNWTPYRLGSAMEAAGLVLLETLTLSSDATADLTAFDNSKYSSYLVTLEKVVPATDDVDLRARTSSDGGSTFDSGASDYKHGEIAFGSSITSVTPTGSTAETYMKLTYNAGTGERVGSGAGEGVSGHAWLMGAPLTSIPTVMIAETGWQNAGALYGGKAVAERSANADVDGLQFLFSSGNIESGTIRLYGVAQ